MEIKNQKELIFDIKMLKGSLSILDLLSEKYAVGSLEDQLNDCRVKILEEIGYGWAEKLYDSIKIDNKKEKDWYDAI